MNSDELRPHGRTGNGSLRYILGAASLSAGILIGVNAFLSEGPKASILGADPKFLMKVSYEPGHEDCSNIHSIEILWSGDATLHRYNKQARKMEAVLLKPKDAKAIRRHCELMSHGDSKVRGAAMGFPNISVWISPHGGDPARTLRFSTNVSEAPFRWVDRHARRQVGDDFFKTQAFEVEFAKQLVALLKEYE